MQIVHVRDWTEAPFCVGCIQNTSIAHHNNRRKKGHLFAIWLTRFSVVSSSKWKQFKRLKREKKPNLSSTGINAKEYHCPCTQQYYLSYGWKNPYKRQSNTIAAGSKIPGEKLTCISLHLLNCSISNMNISTASFSWWLLITWTIVLHQKNDLNAK